jgi:3'-phosphoadenosine 5'-phosphosulfate sulfotransferase (PAPS reductase)/FAD synthetase
MTNNPFLITEPTVISFSGGRTSAYMLWRVLQAHNGKLPEDAIVCFANTGKEEESTLQFVHDCEKAWNVKINWLEYQPEKQKFKVVNFNLASRNGEPFEALITKRSYLPNPIARFCTSELKVLTIDRYMQSIGKPDYVTLVGIRADEPRRVAKMKTNKDEKLTPLATVGITEQDVWKFWNSHTFDLSLPKVNGASNCDLCFLKGAGILVGLIAQKPERAIWWADMEKKIGGRFSKDKPTYEQMMQYNKDQMPLFNDESVACFCGD